MGRRYVGGGVLNNQKRSVFLFLSLSTAHLNRKNIPANNSTWDFDGIIDTMDLDLFLPNGNCSPHTSLSNIFGTQKMGADVDKIFRFPKRCIREKFRLQNLGVVEVFFCLKVLSISHFEDFLEQLLQTIWIGKYEEKNIHISKTVHPRKISFTEFRGSRRVFLLESGVYFSF